MYVQTIRRVRVYGGMCTRVSYFGYINNGTSMSLSMLDVDEDLYLDTEDAAAAVDELVAILTPADDADDDNKNTRPLPATTTVEISLQCPVCKAIIVDVAERQDFSCGHFCCRSCCDETCPHKCAGNVVSVSTPFYIHDAVAAYIQAHNLARTCPDCGASYTILPTASASSLWTHAGCAYTCVSRGCKNTAKSIGLLCQECTDTLVRDAVNVCMTSRGSKVGKKHHKRWANVTRADCNHILRKLVE